jgi:hypothetical protein
MIDLNGDKLELIERQLTERVTERVRSALFRLYAAVGVAVISVLGFLSCDISLATFQMSSSNLS